MEAVANSNETLVPQRARNAALARFWMPAFSLQHPGSEHRRSLESYIRARFLASHGAEINSFLPDLISLGRDEQFCAAVGLGSAASGRLFAEIYLDAPIEQLISAARGESVERREILEIGNLVSTWKGSGLALFVFLSEVVDQLGVPYVIFTATREVERLLAKLQYAPVVLADADPSRLPDGGASWGNYYCRQPRVMFGVVRPAVSAARDGLAYRVLARAMGSQVQGVIDDLRRRHPAL